MMRTKKGINLLAITLIITIVLTILFVFLSHSANSNKAIIDDKKQAFNVHTVIPYAEGNLPPLIYDEIKLNYQKFIDRTQKHIDNKEEFYMYSKVSNTTDDGYAESEFTVNDENNFIAEYTFQKYEGNSSKNVLYTVREGDVTQKSTTNHTLSAEKNDIFDNILVDANEVLQNLPELQKNGKLTEAFYTYEDSNLSMKFSLEYNIVEIDYVGEDGKRINFSISSEE